MPAKSHFMMKAAWLRDRVFINEKYDKLIKDTFSAFVEIHETRLPASESTP